MFFFKDTIGKTTNSKEAVPKIMGNLTITARGALNLPQCVGMETKIKVTNFFYLLRSKYFLKTPLVGEYEIQEKITFFKISLLLPD